MPAHAQWQEREERDEPTAYDHKLPRFSHSYACFSMLEPKYGMGYSFSQLGEKAPELIRVRVGLNTQFKHKGAMRNFGDKFSLEDLPTQCKH